MTKFERWYLKRIIAREVVQGPLHAKNIQNLYSMIREACEKEFYEDNIPTMDFFLLELFDATQKSVPRMTLTDWIQLTFS